MVEIRIEADHLHVEVLGWSKLWAMRSRLDVPLRCVKHARLADGDIPRNYPIRFPGTGFPGVIAAGSFTDFSFKRSAFFDIRNRRENVLVVDLAEWKYEVLVVEVRDARAAAEMINAAIAALPHTEPSPPR